MLCCSLNIPYLIVKIDAKVVVDVLQNYEYVNHVISLILDYCRQLMTRFQQIHVKYCYCRANRCADLMARLGADQELDYIMLDRKSVV